MSTFMKLFKPSLRPKILAMIHVKALPGSPLYAGSMDYIIDKACEEARLYKEIGVDGVILENMFDVPWSRDVRSCTVAAMTSAALEVNRVLKVKGDSSFNPTTPMGIQLLAAANVEALSVANATGGSFIRAEGFVYSHIADKGWIDACAAKLLRERVNMRAQHIHVLADIKKKHSSHAITDDISLTQTAQSAELFLSDGVIITGSSTGVATNPAEVTDVISSVNIPVIVGSGVTADNLKDYKHADAIIIGSSLKVDGDWKNDVCKNRLASFMDSVYAL